MTTPYNEKMIETRETFEVAKEALQKLTRQLESLERLMRAENFQNTVASCGFEIAQAQAQSMRNMIYALETSVLSLNFQIRQELKS